jgi:hypothetical protein
MEEFGESLYTREEDGAVPHSRLTPYLSALVLSILDETEGGEDV